MGGVKASVHYSALRAADDWSVPEVSHLLAELLPGPADQHLRSVDCTYTLTPDEHFVVGRHPALPAVVVACGFSGHGFKFTPVLGEVLADLATGELPAFDLDVRPRRFATGERGCSSRSCRQPTSSPTSPPPSRRCVRRTGPQWVPSERWHLTLAFYGELADAEADRASRRVARAVRGVGRSRCRSPVRGASATGSCGWASRATSTGCGRSPRGVGRAEALPRAPHRRPGPRRQEPRTAAGALATYAGPGWSADEVRLVRSELGPQPRPRDARGLAAAPA